MRFIEDLCPPALLYLIFLAVQLGLDAALGMWVTFGIKVFVGFAMVAVLDTFCGVGLGPVSWFIVAAPFVITALGTAIAMGTQFDARVLGQVKEEFYQEDDKETDVNVPNSSVSVNRMVNNQVGTS